MHKGWKISINWIWQTNETQQYAHNVVPRSTSWLLRCSFRYVISGKPHLFSSVPLIAFGDQVFVFLRPEGFVTQLGEYIWFSISRKSPLWGRWNILGLYVCFSLLFIVWLHSRHCRISAYGKLIHNMDTSSSVSPTVHLEPETQSSLNPFLCYTATLVCPLSVRIKGVWLSYLKRKCNNFPGKYCKNGTKKLGRKETSTRENWGKV